MGSITGGAKKLWSSVFSKMKIDKAGKVKTPFSNPDDFTKLKGNQGYKTRMETHGKKTSYTKTIGISVIKRVRKLEK